MVVLLAVVAAVSTQDRAWSSASSDAVRSTRVPTLALFAGIGLLWLALVVLWVRRLGGVRRLTFSPVWVLSVGALAAVLLTFGLVLHGHLDAFPFQDHGCGFKCYGRVGEGVRVEGGANHHPGKPKGQRGVPYAWTSTAAGLAFVLLGSTAVLVRRRRQSAFPVEDGEEDVAHAVSIWLEESLDDLRQESDARRAVIACYARMERALGRLGLQREPFEAPFEFLERALAHLRAGGDSVRRLTDLFEEAKFSDHVVSERMRADAIDALSRLQRELKVTSENLIRQSVPRGNADQRTNASLRPPAPNVRLPAV